MEHLSSPGHSVTVEVNLPATQVFDFFTDPMNLGKWALGSWDTHAADEDGLFYGTSLVNGENSFFRMDVDAKRYIVDFLVGPREQLKPRISLRVIDGEVYGNSNSCCLVTLSAWREFDMDDARWHQLCICHETEILIIKALLERDS